VGKYFGKQPRYSREEAEAQARQAIDAAVSKGRPPEEDWKALGPRMAEINQELAMRPRPDVDFGPPPSRGRDADRPAVRRPVNQILRPRPAPVEEEAPPPAPAPAPKKRAPRAAAPAKRATPPPAKRPAAKKKRPE
jgi:hypothetical protein